MEKIVNKWGELKPMGMGPKPHNTKLSWHTMIGGNPTKYDDLYKNKYLKYKNKYLKHKK